jgi:hypothetical protein
MTVDSDEIIPAEIDPRVTTWCVFSITLNENVERFRFFALMFMNAAVFNALMFYAIFSTKLYIEDYDMTA